MTAKGSFEVDLTPQADADFPAGRMHIDKKYDGGMVGTGIGQMISRRTQSGAAVYFAIEEFNGTLDGKSGGFTLLHKGQMSAQAQSLEIDVLAGSGSGELESISGSMQISQTSDGHSYELAYEL